MRDEDFENKRYEEALATEKRKRAAKKVFIRSVLVNVIYFMFGNLFAFLTYSIILSKLVAEKLQTGDDVSGLVLTFSVIVQFILIFICSLRYCKEGDENRRFLAASREEGFSVFGYYTKTLKRYGWLAPLTYFIFQLPFLFYHLVLGYYYEAETAFAHYYIPQLCLMEKLGSVVGVICNVLLFSLVYFAVIIFTQKSWLRNRIRG